MQSLMATWNLLFQARRHCGPARAIAEAPPHPHVERPPRRPFLSTAADTRSSPSRLSGAFTAAPVSPLVVHAFFHSWGSSLNGTAGTRVDRAGKTGGLISSHKRSSLESVRSGCHLGHTPDPGILFSTGQGHL
ncbi:hypothetical protein NDU88_005265 [Pleurodeles waltl]|uniref:Uncharacterized protein n=1 Tax=Pleurodeles waltl TaxID=8319 RepID=A0AAV7VKK3_PLEWA|nr:hypothetical protein NDU88_005265 [Pleurodeles waltl]